MRAVRCRIAPTFPSERRMRSRLSKCVSTLCFAALSGAAQAGVLAPCSTAGLPDPVQGTHQSFGGVLEGADPAPFLFVGRGGSCDRDRHGKARHSAADDSPDFQPGLADDIEGFDAIGLLHLGGAGDRFAPPPSQTVMVDLGAARTRRNAIRDLQSLDALGADRPMSGRASGATVAEPGTLVLLVLALSALGLVARSKIVPARAHDRRA